MAGPMLCNNWQKHEVPPASRPSNRMRCRCGVFVSPDSSVDAASIASHDIDANFTK